MAAAKSAVLSPIRLCKTDRCDPRSSPNDTLSGREAARPEWNTLGQKISLSFFRGDIFATVLMPRIPSRETVRMDIGDMGRLLSKAFPAISLVSYVHPIMIMASKS